MKGEMDDVMTIEEKKKRRKHAIVYFLVPRGVAVTRRKMIGHQIDLHK